MELLAEPRVWERDPRRPRRVGVSSFGISGTNAHVIIEEGDSEPAVETLPVPVGGVAWALSAKSEVALRAQAGRLAEWTADSDEGLVETALALAGRSRFGVRAVVVGESRQSLVTQLLEVAGGSGLTSSKVPAGGSVAVLFSGQGSQRVGMGLGLRGVLPVFTEVFDEVCEQLGLSVDLLSDVEALSRTEVTQPALFAVQVAAYRQLEAWGLSASWLGGHSIGELSAAHIAGVWDLEGACKVVAARGRLMGQARAGGAMAALEATEAEVLASLPDGVGIAAVNGPTSVVVSGDAEAVDALVDMYKSSGSRASKLAVSHAFHSHHMDSALEEFERIVASVPASAPRLKLVSTLTGTELAEEATEASYWVRQLRHAVRFADAVSFLAEQGAGVFVDVSPDGVLTSMISGVVEEAVVVPTLRKDVDEPLALTHTAAALHAAGHDIAWPTVLGSSVQPGGVVLPTYAFEHARYWLDIEPSTGDVRSAGLGASDHPLLGARVGLAGGGCVLTGRLAVSTQRWLADHMVSGTVLLPGTGLVDLAIRAGDEVGCPLLRELTLQAPLVLSADGARQLQITVSAPLEDGTCEVAIHSRPDEPTSGGQGGQGGQGVQGGEAAVWTQHASGVLAAAEPDGRLSEFGVWPPEDAESVSVEGLYDTLAAAGFDYGPTFQGLREAWRSGDELFVEVALPTGDGADLLASSVSGSAAPTADAFGLHPALLDSVLHAVSLAGWQEHPGVEGLPFAWSGVVLHATGAGLLRARLAKVAEGGISIVAVDAAGAPVADVERLVLRPLPQVALAEAGARADSIANDVFRISWTAVDTASDGETALVPWKLLRDGDKLADVEDQDAWIVYEPGLARAEEALSVAVRARKATARALDVVQQWVAADRSDLARLVVVTRGAVAVGSEDAGSESGILDLPGAAIWGLIRTAQSEHPGRVVLVDLDDATPHDQAVALAASATDEPQLALRSGKPWAARLARVAIEAEPQPQPTDAEASKPWDPDATVLITGGTGGLGALVARHLVTNHGVRSLLLLSRSGPAARGVSSLITDLAHLGARVRVIAADVSDHAALAAVLATATAADPGRPLRGVVHAAGVLDDGTFETLTPERLDTVMRVKADAAWTLHELTADLALTHFVLFSSAAAAFGAPGQGNYAAANAFLDALATWRSQQGLPGGGVSMAWGLWEQDSGMGGRLGEAQARRLTQTGAALSPERGLALFDLGATLSVPALVLTHLDLAGWRAQTTGAGLPVPAVLRTLVPRGRRAAAAPGARAVPAARVARVARAARRPSCWPGAWRAWTPPNAVRRSWTSSARRSRPCSATAPTRRSTSRSASSTSASTR
ncbi:SDR family NAD(P)-dependent oxidoreductase [Catenulispora yoronensis]